jgi:hypothetical protein
MQKVGEPLGEPGQMGWKREAVEVAAGAAEKLGRSANWRPVPGSSYGRSMAAGKEVG